MGPSKLATNLCLMNKKCFYMNSIVPSNILEMRTSVQNVILFLTLIVSIRAYPPQQRLTEVEWDNYNFHEPQGPGTYAFGYDIQDATTNNVQFRSEERLPNGTVVGSYGFVDEQGYVNTVHYVADHLGYRAKVEKTRRGQLKPIILPQTPSVISTAVRPHYYGGASNANYAIVTPPESSRPPQLQVRPPQFIATGPAPVQPPPQRPSNANFPIWSNFNENLIIDNY